MKKPSTFILVVLFFTACGTSEEKKPEEPPPEKNIEQSISDMQKKAKELHEKSLKLKEQIKNSWDKNSKEPTK